MPFSLPNKRIPYTKTKTIENYYKLEVYRLGIETNYSSSSNVMVPSKNNIMETSKENFPSKIYKVFIFNLACK